MKFINILTTVFIIMYLSCNSSKRIQNNSIEEKQLSNTDTTNTNIKEHIYKNHIFNQNIKTVLCHKEREEYSLPIINLNSDEKLIISFDELNSNRKNYNYTIIHCNADWTKSNLMQSEYIQGFISEPITEYRFSFNTIQEYIHYEFKFPSNNQKPILSGNYILKIYEENGTKAIYQRFMILENKTSIEANVRRATLAQNRNIKHEVDFTIKHQNLNIADPFSDIIIHVKQNNKEDNAITNLKPLFVKNDELVYDYEEENTFWAHNEFRHFDFRSLRFLSERIQDIKFDSNYNTIQLFDDKKRSFDNYSIEPDINGDFKINIQEGWDSSIEADYAYVNFSLPLHHISYGNLYLIGAFSDWQLREEFKLQYNLEEKKYETSVLLKQGYYNYHYALHDTSRNFVDVSFIEGSHYQTRNDYYIYVYLRDHNNNYDRLIGFLKSTSNELF